MAFPTINRAAVHAITIPQGQRWVYPLRLMNVGGLTAVDLTGVTFACRIATRLDSAGTILAEPAVVVTEAAEGRIELRLTSPETADIYDPAVDDPLRRDVRVGAWELIATYLAEDYRVLHGDCFIARGIDA